MEPERPQAIWAPTPPTRLRDGSAIQAALNEFVLNDGTKARIRIESADHAMNVTFLDAPGDPLPGSPVALMEDFSESAGGIDIVGHWAPAHGLAIAESALHNGLLRVFVAYGSREVRFFQYARSEVSLDVRSGDVGLLRDGTGWRLDSGSPYTGTFTCDEPEAIGMFDGPGASPDFDPFEAVARMVQPVEDDASSELADDAVFRLSHEFETLPYGAGGGLLGSITWGYTLTWTLAGGARAEPEVEAVAPVWRRPLDAQSPMPDSLGTEWNPRVTSSRT